jgi:bacillolysin
MKRALLLLLALPICGVSQSSFVQKQKEKSSNVIVNGFTEIDGRSASKGVRKSQSFKADFELRQLPLYKTIRTDDDPTFLQIENLKPVKLAKNAKVSAGSLVFSFLEAVKNEIPVKDIKKSFSIESTNTDAMGNQHVRLKQSLNGVEVYGGELIAHIKQSSVKTLNGHLENLLKPINTTPKILETKAVEIAMNELAKVTSVQEAGLTGSLLKMQRNEASLLLYNHRGELKLAYELVLRPNILERWVYFLDANNGEVLEQYNHTCTLDGVFSTQAVDLNGVRKSFVITQKGSDYFMVDPSKKMFNNQQSSLPDSPVGAIWTIDASNGRIDDRNIQFSHVNSRDGVTWNATGVSAHTNASICYDYFENTFQRNSLNGSGGNIISVINIADQDGGGMDNAYWNGEFMGYGNGRDGFKPLAGALDVAGHEMTHGVIENTAKLEYRNQSGALNESFADIFGAMIDRDDWTLGEDVVRASAFPSGALRSLENPNQGGSNDRGYQPKNMGQYVYLRDIPSEDNGGVHINSGITNHAFYLFVTAAGMNKEKAEKIYYHTLTNYLTRTSKFVDLRLAVIQSANDLFGNGQEVAAAKKAFDAVGIVEPSSSGGGTTPNPTPQEQEIPVNPGDQFLVVYEPEGRDLYRGKANLESSFSVIGQGIGCKKKPSITDDGGLVFWVGDNGNIYVKNLKTTAAPQALTDNGAWDNVAVSKNGELLAALTTDAEPFIYVFDLVSDKNVKFRLFNPTYTQGVSTGEVLYADALEWDYSGEYLIYDAFNRASGIFGDLEYWDVGILKAWDVATGNFTDGGDIQKIFTDLDEGDNIGNPAISKTNPNVIAFDYLNSSDGQILVIGANLATGDLNVIVENNEIGFPDYSVDDNVMVYNSRLNTGEEVVRKIALNSDRISSPMTTGQRLFSAGQDKWAVFFAQGERALPQRQVQTINFPPIPDKAINSVFNLNATASSQLAVQYTLSAGNASIAGNQITCGNMPGKVTVEAFQIGNSNFTSVNAEQTFCIIPPAPSLSLNGTTAVAQGGTLYQWYVNGRPINGQTTNNTFDTRQFSGLFNVQSITQDGCGSALSNGIATEQLLAIEENDLHIEVYPNPLKNVLSVTLPSAVSLKSLEIWNALGMKVLESKDSKIKTEGLNAGSYTLKINTSEGIYTKKVVKL